MGGVAHTRLPVCRRAGTRVYCPLFRVLRQTCERSQAVSTVKGGPGETQQGLEAGLQGSLEEGR